jgi:DNA replication protein DnaC
MIAITDYIKNLNSEIEKKQTEINSKRFQVKLSASEFKEIFLLEAKNEMLKRNIDKEFIVDETNKHMINYLFYYLIGAKEFPGNLNKGILISGSLGIGKTIIMNAFCNIYENLCSKVFVRLHSKKIIQFIKSKEPGYLDKRPVFIDDLGREPVEINDYGTKERPIVDLISIRYDTGALTFATTNFKTETLTEFYGQAIVDRFKEMFNYVEIIGESKRK